MFPDEEAARAWCSEVVSRRSHDVLTRGHGLLNPLPVWSVAELRGPAFSGRTLEGFLPVTEVGKMPPFDIDREIDRVTEERSPEVRCYLAEDWHFADIAKEAWLRPGHQYEGRRPMSLAEQLVLALYDLEKSLNHFHPTIPVEAVLCFWTSWQLSVHVHGFSQRLKRKPVEVFEGNAARAFVGRQIMSYANEVRSGSGTGEHGKLPGKSPSATPEELLNGKELVTYKTAAEVLGIGDRQVRNLVELRELEARGKGSVKRITSASLLRRLSYDKNSEESGSKRK